MYWLLSELGAGDCLGIGREMDEFPVELNAGVYAVK